MNKVAHLDMSYSVPLAASEASGMSGIVDRGNPILTVDAISHAYGRLRSLDDVSFDLSPGEILALVGHSGSGKSTLLRIIAGLERPIAGEVEIAGRCMCGRQLFIPPERRGVGLMFQDYALFPHMTIRENVGFGLARLPRREADLCVSEALARVGLADRAGDYPHMLSGGEQQRVALARALAPAPSVLLMDEPFSNLDRRTRDVVRDETIRVLRESGAAAILVTHDAEEAMRLADRIVLLRAGHVVQADTPEQLYRHPASLFVARFFSEFDEIEGTIRDGRADTSLGAFPAAGMAEGTRATVCIRPGAIRIGKNGAGVAGRVLSRRFLGESDLVHVGVEGVPRALHTRIPAHYPLRQGEPVHLELSADDVMVFATEEASVRSA